MHNQETCDNLKCEHKSMELPKKIEFFEEPDPSRPAGTLDMRLAAETINDVIDYLSEKEIDSNQPSK